ncbi:hypothetical protein ACVWZZ_006123 [Bradyrhizobium sp. LM6.10]
MSFAWNEKISAITTERLASGSRMVFGDDLSDIHHPCRSDIVAEWVNFQSAVTEEPINLGANANVIGIDIETTFHQQVAQAKVIGLHGGVVASIEGMLVAAT